MHRGDPFRSTPDRDGVPAAFAWTIVALLAALHAAPFLVTFVEVDFARDLDAATRIVEGERWPLRGPVLAWTLHLGPLWYWLLALPLAIARSIAAAAGVVAVLAALQFPLAYRLGAAVAGRSTGLAFAVFLALPGLSTLEGLWIAHPSLVPTAVVAVALCAWHAGTRRSAGWWIASMLAASLALHAHPTTLPVLALPLVAAARALRDGESFRLGALVLGSSAFLLPFMPLAWDAGTHADELTRFAAGVSTDVARFAPRRWLEAMAGVAWRAPDAIGATMLPQAAGRTALRFALGVLYAFALAGTAFALLGQSRRWRRPVLLAIAAFAVTVALAVAVRDTTRFYMLYAATVPLAAWLSLAVAALPSRGFAGLSVRVVPVALALALFVATSASGMLRAFDGEVRVPAALSPVADLSTGVPRGHVALATLTPRDHDRIGARLCARNAVRAFGELAGIVDVMRNVPARLQCGGATRVVLGGTGEGVALAMLLADALPGVAHGERLHAFAWAAVGTAHAPAEALPLASGGDYPWRRACGPPAPVTSRFTARGPGLLVVSNALPVTCPMTVRRIARDGAAMAARQHLDSHVVALPSGDSAWEVEVGTGEPRALQIFTLAGGG